MRRTVIKVRQASRPGKRQAGIVLNQLPHSPKHAQPLSPADLIDAVQAGFPVQELIALQECLNIPLDKLTPRLGIPKATLHRRKAQGRLDPEESDRVLRFARLLGRAVAVFGNEEDARQWLTSTQFGLGGAVPLDYAKTEVGAREVENLLGRIEHGVYS